MVRNGSASLLVQNKVWNLEQGRHTCEIDLNQNPTWAACIWKSAPRLAPGEGSVWLSDGVMKLCFIVVMRLSQCGSDPPVSLDLSHSLTLTGVQVLGF